MYQVNLLPWRQRRWRRRAIRLAAVLAAELLLALGSASMLAWSWREERAALAAQSAALQRQELDVRRQVQQRRRCVERLASLEGVMRAYRQAEAGNRYPSLLINRLALSLPPGLWLTSVQWRDGRLAVDGCSRDYGAILETNRRLGRRLLPVSPHWREIIRLENGMLRFRLQADYPVKAQTDAPR